MCFIEKERRLFFSPLSNNPASITLTWRWRHILERWASCASPSKRTGWRGLAAAGWWLTPALTTAAHPCLWKLAAQRSSAYKQNTWAEQHHILACRPAACPWPAAASTLSHEDFHSEEDQASLSAVVMLMVLSPPLLIIFNLRTDIASVWNHFNVICNVV